jgi:UDP-N-acetyl-D-glucosamine dehydrogenase
MNNYNNAGLPMDKIQHYIELGCEVKGLGRGHIKRIKDRIQKN